MAKLLPAAIGLFAVGLLAVIVIFVLFAAGSTNPPVWLYVPAMLVPVGLAMAVVGVVRRNR